MSRILAFAVCFSAILTAQARPTIADMPAFENGFSLYKAVFELLLAVKQYDVRVHEWSSHFAKIEADREFFSECEVDSVARQIYDGSTEKCLMMRRDVLKSSGENGLKWARPMNWQLHFFDQGQYIGRKNLYQPVIDRPEKLKFDEFCSLAKITFYPGAGLLKYPVTLSQRFAEGVQVNIESRRKSVSRAVGRDSVRIVHASEENPTTVIHLLNTQQLAPMTYSYLRTIDGKAVSLYNHTVECAEFNGVYLPVKMSFTRQDTTNVQEMKRSIPIDVVGTVEFEWLSVNPEALEYPDHKQLAYDVEKWSEFLNLETANKPTK